MSVNRRSYTRKFVGLVGSTMLLILVLVIWNHHVKARAGQSEIRQVESHDVGSQMVNYTKQGRYDDAIQIGLQSLQNQPSDEIIYEGIATVCLIRAQKDSQQREKWVETAVSYAEKALALNSKDKDVAGVHLFQDARSFEVAGDLSTILRCSYYERARKLLENRAPLLQGDQLTLEGRVFPLAPLRKENERTLADVKAKAAKAACK